MPPDDFVCDSCNPPKHLPTAKGLKIHTTNVHGTPAAPPQTTEQSVKAKEKIDQIIAKASPSRLANILLRRLARTYNDPEIAFSEEELSDVDGALRDLMAEVDNKTIEPYLKYAPYVAALFIAGPIVLDKLGRIADKGRSAPVAAPKPAPKPANGSAPTLTRKDVMPDA
jgi:hypothetical protein